MACDAAAATQAAADATARASAAGWRADSDSDAQSDAGDGESALAAPPLTPLRALARGGVRIACRLRAAPAGFGAAVRADAQRRSVLLAMSSPRRCAAGTAGAAREEAFGPFDGVYGSAATHGEVFASVQPLCAHAAAGGAALALLTGATSSGKSFTLWGGVSGPAAGSAGSAAEPALAVRTLCELLRLAQQAAGPARRVDTVPASARGAAAEQRAMAPATTARDACRADDPGEGGGGTASLLVSLLQVYNGAVYDLLGSGNGGQQAPHAAAHPCASAAPRPQRAGRLAPPPLEVRCRTAADVRACLAIGGCFRRTADSGLNTRSSRAHTVVVARIVSAGGERSRGVLRLVDLAGAESAEPGPSPPEVGAGGGQRADELDAATRRAQAEATHISSSLAALDSAFAEMRARRPANFRASALTQLLAPALDLERGAQVLVLAHVHESARWLAHSRRTLEFARGAGDCN